MAKTLRPFVKAEQQKESEKKKQDTEEELQTSEQTGGQPSTSGPIPTPRSARRTREPLPRGRRVPTEREAAVQRRNREGMSNPRYRGLEPGQAMVINDPIGGSRIVGRMGERVGSAVINDEVLDLGHDQYAPSKQSYQRMKDEGVLDNLKGEELEETPAPWIMDPAAQQEAHEQMVESGLRHYVDGSGNNWYTLSDGSVVCDKQEGITPEQQKEIAKIRDDEWKAQHSGNSAPEIWKPDAVKLAATLAETFCNAYNGQHLAAHINSFRSSLRALLNGDLLGAVSDAVDASFNGLRIIGDGVDSFKNAVKERYGIDPDAALVEGVATMRAKLAQRETKQTEGAIKDCLEDLAKTGDRLFGTNWKVENGDYESVLKQAGINDEQLAQVMNVLNANTYDGLRATGDVFTDDEKSEIVRMLVHGDYGSNPELMGKFIGYLDTPPQNLHMTGYSVVNPFLQAQLSNQEYDFRAGLGELGQFSNIPQTPVEKVQAYYAHMRKRKDEIDQQLLDAQRGWRYVYQPDGTPYLDTAGEPVTEEVEPLSSMETRVLQSRKKVYEQAMEGMMAQAMQNPTFQAMYARADEDANNVLQAQFMSERKRRDILGHKYDSTPEGGAYRVLAGGKYNEVTIDEDGTPQYDSYRGGRTALDRVRDAREDYRARAMATGMTEAELHEDQAWISLYNAEVRMSVKKDYDDVFNYLACSGRADAAEVMEELNGWYDGFCEDYDWMGSGVELKYREYDPRHFEKFYDKLGLKKDEIPNMQVGEILPSVGFSGPLTENPITGAPNFGRTNAKSGQRKLLDGPGVDVSPGSLYYAYATLHNKYKTGQAMTKDERIQYNTLRSMRAYQIRERELDRMCRAVDVALKNKGIKPAQREAIKGKLRSMFGGRQSWSWKQGEVGENYTGPEDGVASLSNIGWNPDWDLSTESGKNAAYQWFESRHLLDKPQSPFATPPDPADQGGKKKKKDQIGINDYIRQSVDERLEDMSADANYKDKADEIRKMIDSGEVSKERLDYTITNHQVMPVDLKGEFAGKTWDEVFKTLSTECKVLEDMGYFGNSVSYYAQTSARASWVRSMKSALMDGALKDYMDNPSLETISNCVADLIERAAGDDRQTRLAMAKDAVNNVKDSEEATEKLIQMFGDTFEDYAKDYITPRKTPRERKSGKKEGKNPSERPENLFTGIPTDIWEQLSALNSSLTIDPVTGLPVKRKTGTKAGDGIYAPKSQGRFIDELDAEINRMLQEQDVDKVALAYMVALRNTCNDGIYRTQLNTTTINGLHPGEIGYDAARDEAISQVGLGIWYHHLKQAQDSINAASTPEEVVSVIQDLTDSSTVDPYIQDLYEKYSIRTSADVARDECRARVENMRKLILQGYAPKENLFASASPELLGKIDAYLAGLKEGKPVIPATAEDWEGFQALIAENGDLRKLYESLGFVPYNYGAVEDSEYGVRGALLNENVNGKLNNMVTEAKGVLGEASLAGDDVKTVLALATLAAIDDYISTENDMSVLKKNTTFGLYGQDTPAKINGLNSFIAMHPVADVDDVKFLLDTLDSEEFQASLGGEMFKRLGGALKFGGLESYEGLSKAIDNTVREFTKKLGDDVNAQAIRAQLGDWFKNKLWSEGGFEDKIQMPEEEGGAPIDYSPVKVAPEVDKLLSSGAQLNPEYLKAKEQYAANVKAKQDKERTEKNKRLKEWLFETPEASANVEDYYDDDIKDLVGDLEKTAEKRIEEAIGGKEGFKNNVTIPEETLASLIDDDTWYNSGKNKQGESKRGIVNKDKPLEGAPQWYELDEDARKAIINGIYSRMREKALKPKLTRDRKPSTERRRVVRPPKEEQVAAPTRSYKDLSGEEFEYKYGNNKTAKEEHLKISLEGFKDKMRDPKSLDKKSGVFKDILNVRNNLMSLGMDNIKDSKGKKIDPATVTDNLNKLIDGIYDNVKNNLTNGNENVTEGNLKETIRRDIMEPVREEFMSAASSPHGSWKWMGQEDLQRAMGFTGKEIEQNKKYYHDCNDILSLKANSSKSSGENDLDSRDNAELLKLIPKKRVEKDKDEFRVWTPAAGSDLLGKYKKLITGMVKDRLEGKGLSDDDISKAVESWVSGKGLNGVDININKVLSAEPFKGLRNFAEDGGYGATEKIKLEKGTLEISPKFWADMNKELENLKKGAKFDNNAKVAYIDDAMKKDILLSMGAIGENADEQKVVQRFYELFQKDANLKNSDMMGQGGGEAWVEANKSAFLDICAKIIVMRRFNDKFTDEYTKPIKKSAVTKCLRPKKQ